MSFIARLRAYLELARVSNLPTCASDVLVGAVIAVRGEPLPIVTTIAMIAAISLLYITGMVLNDVFDIEIDRQERPDRPLPSGRVSREAAMRFLWVTGTLGLGIIAVIGFVPFLFGLGLSICIAVYDAMHGHSRASVLIMGACRALVYLTTAAAMSWPIEGMRAGPLAAGLAVYVVVLSLVAAVEASSAANRRGWLAILLPLPALAPLAVVRPDDWVPVVIAAAVLVLWVLWSSRHLRAAPPRIGAAVSGWIAAICLVDAVYLCALDRPMLALVAGACFVATLLAQRRIAGT